MVERSYEDETMDILLASSRPILIGSWFRFFRNKLEVFLSYGYTTLLNRYL